MTDFKISISYWWLLLLLIPAIVLTLLPYFRMNKRYRRNRNRVVSIVLHLLVMTLCVFTLAGVTFDYDTPNTENEIIILLDSSFSSRDAEDAKEDVVSAIIDYGGDNYKVGIVKFGYNQVYAAPLSNDGREVYRQYLASDDPDTSATDIASALRYASGLVTNPDTAKIVLVSDGVETDGNAVSAIRSVAAMGIKVDVIPLGSTEHDELQIMGVSVPETDIVEGVEFTLGLKLHSNFGGTEEHRVVATLYDNGEKTATYETFLLIGEQTLNLTHTFETRGLHEIKIEVSSTTPQGDDIDTVRENNTYYTYILLAEYDNILILEKEEGESAALQKALVEEMEKTLTVYSTDIEEDRAAIPNTITALSEYDQVILVNIANSDMPDGFSEILYDYVNRLGGGLFTVGGKNYTVGDKLVPHAYNREDMAQAALEGDTYYQQLLPVQVVDYTPPVAVVALIDTSGSMSDKIGPCKDAAISLLNQLNPWDYFGAATFYDTSKETVQIMPVSRKDEIAQRIYAISNYNSGGTSFASGVSMAAEQLASVNAPRKHIIFFTDGEPGDPDDFAAEAKRIYEESNHIITTSIAVAGGNPDDAFLRDACAAAGGKYLYAGDYSSLGYEDLKNNVVQEIQYGEEFSLLLQTQASPITKGLSQKDLNEIKFTGYYGTRLKDGAEAPISAQLVPMYAHWTVGNGTVGSFMCDLGGEWSGDFLETATGKQFLSNVITSIFPAKPIMPPGLEVVNVEDNYGSQLNVYTQVPEGGSVDVKVTPISADAVQIYGDKEIQVSAFDGGTRFTFGVQAPGIYKVDVNRSDSQGNTVTYTLYKTLAYSAEYNVFDTPEVSGEQRLAIIAQLGNGIEAEDPLDIFQSFVKFIHRHVDPRMVFLIIAIVLFLLDIAVRKFKFKWIHELVRDRKAKKALLNEQNK